MQRILVLLAFVCLALPALQAQNARRVTVYFQHSHSQQDLMNIKAELGAQGIVLDYTHMKFDDHGHLAELEFSVDCQDGFKGSAKSMDVPADMTFGFIRDYGTNVTMPFAVGDLSEE
ncbi:MAG: hypothetical protein EP344_02665 [Bacteroidetes bacterium]|nr:MAG: hypothetical protein EP344_02665 [Bacteroidota bacterium]